MIFEQALSMYDLKTLKGATEDSLTKKKRGLLKENHPDTNKPGKYTIKDILEAYDLLIANLNGQNLQTVLDSYEYTVLRRKRHKKVLNYADFVKFLDIKDRKIVDLNDEYLLFISFPFKLRHYREDVMLGEYEKVYEFKYEKGNEYALEFSLDYEFGDKLLIDFNYGDKVLEGKLNSVQNMLLISLNLTIIDNLRFVITVIKSVDSDMKL